MARTLTLKRKLEVAIAGYLVDQQKLDPTFLPGITVVCGTTGRSPDDPEESAAVPSEPELPYISVGCEQARALPDFPTGYGMKEATVVIFSKTHAGDDSRSLADERESDVASIFEDPSAMLAALNQPADPAAPDERRVTGLYLYAIEDPMSADEHSGDTWEEETTARVVCQGFDPDRE